MAIILYDLCGRDPELRFSPFCWRIKMAIAQKGLAVETKATPFTEIPDIAPGKSKTVPVVNDNGTFVFGSMDIAIYLDQAYPDRPPLFDSDGLIAACRILDSWAARSLHSVIAKMMVRDIHDILAEADQAYFRESREERFGKTLEEVQLGTDVLANDLAQALAPVRSALGINSWLGGARPLFSDFIVFGPLMWLYTVTGVMPLAEGDPIISWFNRCLGLNDGFAFSARRAA